MLYLPSTILQNREVHWGVLRCSKWLSLEWACGACKVLSGMGICMVLAFLVLSALSFGSSVARLYCTGSYYMVSVIDQSRGHPTTRAAHHIKQQIGSVVFFCLTMCHRDFWHCYSDWSVEKEGTSNQCPLYQTTILVKNSLIFCKISALLINQQSCQWFMKTCLTLFQSWISWTGRGLPTTTVSLNRITIVDILE